MFRSYIGFIRLKKVKFEGFNHIGNIMKHLKRIIHSARIMVGAITYLTVKPSNPEYMGELAVGITKLGDMYNSESVRNPFRLTISI